METGVKTISLPVKQFGNDFTGSKYRWEYLNKETLLSTVSKTLFLINSVDMTESVATDCTNK